MTADEIRAEIARLQQMLQQVEGFGKDNSSDLEYSGWLSSMEDTFKQQGKWDYFELVNGRLVFNPSLARDKESATWKSEKAKKRQLAIKQEEEMRKLKERMQQSIQKRLQAEALKKQQNPGYEIPQYYQSLIDQANAGSGGMKSPNMPPAWS